MSEAYNNTRRTRAAVKLAAKTCRECGGPNPTIRATCSEVCSEARQRNQGRANDARRRPRPIHEVNCKDCGISFTHSGLGRPRQYCPECRVGERRHVYRKYVLGTARKSHLKHKYGMTPERYDELLALQHGRCSICDEIPGDRPLGVDHDHSCCPDETSCGDCVRGLLCHRCNVGIGLLRDDPNLLRVAAAYIESNHKENAA